MLSGVGFDVENSVKMLGSRHTVAPQEESAEAQRRHSCPYRAQQRHKSAHSVGTSSPPRPPSRGGPGSTPRPPAAGEAAGDRRRAGIFPWGEKGILPMRCYSLSGLPGREWSSFLSDVIRSVMKSMVALTRASCRVSGLTWSQNVRSTKFAGSTGTRHFSAAAMK